MIPACVQFDCIPGRTPFCPCIPLVDYVLLFVATIDPTSEGEEGYEGEDCAGEGPGQPGTTGKPPLALASLLSYIAMHMLWFMKITLFRW